MSRIKGGVTVWVTTGLLSLFAGCVTGPSPAHMACLDRCQHGNDQCLLAAMTAGAVQQCSGWSSGCIASCPP